MYLSRLKVIAGIFEAVGVAFEDTTPLVRTYTCRTGCAFVR